MNLDPTLLQIFETEQQEHVSRLRLLLEPSAGGAVLSTPVEIEEALRRAHTLKGAARAVGLGPTELLAHRVETVFARIRDRALAADETTLAVIRQVLDTVEDVLGAVVDGRPEPDTSGVLAALESVLSARPSAVPPGPALTFPSAPAPQPSRQPAPDQRADTVRVNTKTIDDLVRTSSQLLSAANRQQRAAREVSEVADRIVAAKGHWARLRRRAAQSLRPLEDDPRYAALLECLHYMDSEIDALTREARTAKAAQQRNSWDIQRLAAEEHREACRVRMTPAESVFGGFAKMVRDLARDEGKQVEFRAEGLDVLADRLVLQALKDPVMHLLRNAIAHGIEPAERRAAAGKPRAGAIRLLLEARGDRLKVEVEDDGRGIDAASIARIAVRRGLITQAAVSSLAWQDIVKLILQPGFSTSESLTTLAGRGMGMSVVQDEVTRLQGEVAIRDRNGSGTAIALSVPLSISTQQVLLVACGEQTFGIPAWAVKRLCRISLPEIESVDGTEAIRIDSNPVPLARLSDLLGRAQAQPERSDDRSPKIFVAVLESANRRLGVIVDALLDQQDALVKDLGLPPASAGLASGGVPLEHGGVAVVLNAAALLDSYRRSGKTPGLKRAEAEAPKRVPIILVVDDSMTTRSLEKSMLEANGYRVRVAVDGVEALEQIRAERPDLVITDVMMPRMDGLQLLDRIKKDKDSAHIPVIVVTSLEKREDQERGLSLGADAYIVKRKFDQRELLNTIRQIL